MIIDANLVKLNLKATSKEDVLQELATIAGNYGKVINKDEYVAAVLKRENEYSTAVGFGVAIPHGKTDAVKEPFVMFATVNNIDWNSMDGNPVDQVFMIGVPESDASSTHLKILAALSRKLMKEDFRKNLKAQASPEGVISFLKESELGI